MNPMELMQMYSDFMRNPSQMLSKMGVPSNINTPDGIMQYLMDSGKVNQGQYNQARKMAQQMMNQGTPPKRA